MKQKITFIIHGRLRTKEDLKSEIMRKLRNDFDLVFAETRGPGDAIQLASRAVRDNINFLVSVGGDGLLNETVNGFMRCEESERENSCLGLLPYGTGNDFAKTIGASPDIDKLAALLKENKIKKVDLGLMNHISVHGKPASRYFINIADIGIGGYVSQRVNQSSKMLGANLSYMKAIIVSFLTYKHRKVRITADDFKWEGKVLLVVMANGRFFGSGMCIAPQAVADDGKIQLVLLGNVSLLDYFKNIGNVKKGKVIEHPEVQYLKVNSCQIETIEECTIDMDGEFIGYGPIDVKMLPGAVKFLRE